MNDFLRSTLALCLALAASSHAAVVEPTESAFNVVFTADYRQLAGADFTDAVYDPALQRVYLTDQANDQVQRFDVPSRAFLSAYTVGENPSSLDITADNQRLLVTNGNNTALSSINLGTGVVSPLSDPVAETQYSIAIGNGFALYSTVGATGARPRHLNLSNNNISLLSPVGESMRLDASYNRASAFSSFDPTDGEARAGTFDIATGTLLGSSLQALMRQIAANYDASINAGNNLTNTVLVDRNGGEIARVSRPGPPAFTWSGKYLYVGTTTQTLVFSIDALASPQTVAYATSLDGAPASVRILVNERGTQLYLVTSDSVGVVDIQDAAPTISTAQTNVNAFANEENRIAFTVTDGDGNTTAATAFGLPLGATLVPNATGGEIVFTPTSGQIGTTFNVVLFGAEENGLTNSSPLTIAITVVSNDADVSITKTASAGPLIATVPFTYTVVATNHGPAPAPNVVVTDNMPAGVTAQGAVATAGTTVVTPGSVVWNVGTLGSGASATMTITVVAAGGGTISNVAVIQSDRPDPDSSDNSAQVQSTINPAEADLRVSKSVNVNPATINQVFTYTVSTTNDGPVTAPNVVVTDALPANVTAQNANGSQGSTVINAGSVVWSVGTLAPGANATMTIDVIATTTGTIVNTVSVQSDLPDSDPADNSATVQSQVTEPLPFGPDYTGLWQYARRVVYLGSNPRFQVVAGSFKLQNIGTEKAGPTSIRFYLSDDQQYDASDVLVRTMYIRYLYPNRWFWFPFYARVPLGVPISGRYLIAVIDQQNAVQESNENNNVVVAGPLN